MSEMNQGRTYPDPCGPDGTMSINTRKITDACRDKDCIEDLRVYLTKCSQAVFNEASAVRVRCADLIYALVDVEPVAFDRNHYCVEVTFFYRILADATVGSNRPAPLTGLAVFSKRVVLCGEDSKAHIFTSEVRTCGPDGPAHYRAGAPISVVEVLDPMVLCAKMTDNCDCACGEMVPQIPQQVLSLFDDALITAPQQRRLTVTLGQFSIIRLERSAQCVIPVIDSCIPTKACSDTPGATEDPCELFSRIPFPVQQFCPTGCSPTDLSCN